MFTAKYVVNRAFKNFFQLQKLRMYERLFHVFCFYFFSDDLNFTLHHEMSKYIKAFNDALTFFIQIGFG